jgi:hypothetical protein
MKKKLEEGIDFYYNQKGYIVLTEKFHLEKGSCCGNGCLHCPYDYINVPEPQRTILRVKKRNEKNIKES